MLWDEIIDCTKVVNSMKLRSLLADRGERSDVRETVGRDSNTFASGCTTGNHLKESRSRSFP